MSGTSSWKTISIADVAENVFDGPHATPKEARSGPIFLGISSLVDGRLDLSKSGHLSEEDFVRWTRRVSPAPGDLVFSYETRLGEAALIPDGVRCCLGRRMALIRPNRSVVEPRFLLYAYLGPAFQETIRQRTVHGSTVDRLPLIDFPTFPIAVPDLSEQRAIAEVLGALDDKIESNRRLWSLALQLLDGARLETAQRNDASECSLGDVVDFNCSTVKPGAADADLVYIDIASVSPGVINNRQRLTWGDAPSRARRDVADGDVIFSTVRPGRRSFSVILDPDPGTVASTGFAVMTPRMIGTAFLLGTVADPAFAEYCESVSQGSAYPAVSPEAMSRYEVRVPPDAVLHEFESEVMPVLRRGHRALSENEILIGLRDALLPELLTGRMRVREAEEMVGSV